jgi:hypothetical protein
MDSVMVYLGRMVLKFRCVYLFFLSSGSFISTFLQSIAKRDTTTTNTRDGTMTNEGVRAANASRFPCPGMFFHFTSFMWFLY